MKKLSLAALALTLALPVAAFAAEFKAGDISVTDPWSRAAVAANGAAFMTVTNHGAEQDRLVDAASPVAEKVEIHTHTMDGGVMRMRRIDGIDLPAGEDTALRPGGHHIMLIGLHAPLKEGKSFPVTLTFAKSGQVTVEATVAGPGAMGSGAMGSGGMGHGGPQHMTMPAKH